MISRKGKGCCCCDEEEKDREMELDVIYGGRLKVKLCSNICKLNARVRNANITQASMYNIVPSLHIQVLSFIGMEDPCSMNVVRLGNFPRRSRNITAHLLH